MSETCARKPGQRSPRKRRMLRKSLQNQSKMAPKWLPGGLWAASGAQGVSEGASRSSLGGSWGALGASCPRGAPRGHFGYHFCSRAHRHEKGAKKHEFVTIFGWFLGWVFTTVLRLAGAASARAELQKTSKNNGRVCIFRLSAVFARNRKTIEVC